MKQKLNLVFDGNLLANEFDNTSSNRTGVFFVVHNIFLLLVKSKKYLISVYADNSKHDNIFAYFKKYAITNVDILDQHELIVNKSNIDIYLSLAPVFLIPEEIRKQSNISYFIFLHDVTPILFDFESPNLNWYNEFVKQLSNDYFYFANSQSTKNDFINRYKTLDQEKITVTPLAASQYFYRCEKKAQINKIRIKYGIPLDKKYALSLCTIQPRKNLSMAVKAFAEFVKKNNINDMVFALGGSHWDHFFDKFKEEVGDLDIENKVITLGYIDDLDLAALYSGAEFFIYTSLYEGFGLPVLEAMQCGCPVITGSNSSLPEVIGDTGIMIDAYSQEEHIEAMEKYYFDSKLREHNRKKGLLRSKQFSWSITAELMMKEFDKAKKDGKKMIERKPKRGIKTKIKSAVKKLPLIKQLWRRYTDLKDRIYDNKSILESIQSEINNIYSEIDNSNAAALERQLNRLRSWDLVKSRENISLEQEIRGIDAK
jgi:glycosyltransferase involved in cell wall biosynthesis